MEVVSKNYGTIEVDERQKITLISGLFGFEDLKEFVLMDAPQKPFLIFQSIEDQNVAFILIDPAFFRKDYHPNINRSDLEQIGIDESNLSQVLTLAVVTIPQDQNNPITANLQGPLVINRETREGRQFIAQDARWLTRHNIIEEMAEQRKESC